MTTNEKPLFFVFGNKADLVADIEKKNEEIKERIQSLKRKHECIYFYGSAKDFEDEGIERMMSKIVEHLYEQIPKPELKASKLKSMSNSVAEKRQTIKLKSGIHEEEEKKQEKKEGRKKEKKRCFFV